MNNLQQSGVMPQQHPEPENNSFPQKKNSTHKIIIIVICVLLLAGVVYGAWWGYNNYLGDTEKEEVVNLTNNKMLTNDTTSTSDTNTDMPIKNINLEPVYMDEETKLAEERDIKRLTDIKKIQTALDLYYVDQDVFPINISPIILGEDGAQKLCDEGLVDKDKTCQLAMYMDTISMNPLPGGADYIYKSEDGKSYRIDFALELGVKSFRAGPLYATESGIFQETNKLTAEEIKAKEIEAEEKRQNNKDVARVNDVKQYQTGFELYFADQNHYPLVDGKVILGEGDFKVLCDKGFQKDEVGCTKTYLPNILANPIPGGASYLYESMTTKGGKEYRLNFAVENNVGGLKAGSLLATPSGIKNEELDGLLDSDNDELSDSDEIFIWKTDPYKADTDGDSYLDGDEVVNGYDPLIAGSARLEDR